MLRGSVSRTSLRHGLRLQFTDAESGSVSVYVAYVTSPCTAADVDAAVACTPIRRYWPVSSRLRRSFLVSSEALLLRRLGAMLMRSRLHRPPTAALLCLALALARITSEYYL